MESNQSAQGWFSHVEWVVLVITLLGGYYLFYESIQRQAERSDAILQETAAIRQETTARIDTVIQDTAARFEIGRQEMAARTEALKQEMAAMRQETTARSDRLYEMFIDLLKEGKCPKQENLKDETKNIISAQ